MKKLSKFLNVLLGIGAVTGMLCFIISVTIQIFSRTFLPTVPSWTEEVARYTFIYAVSFGAGMCVLDNGYVMVDIVVNYMSPAVKRIHRMIMYGILIAFNVFMVTKSVPKFANLKFRMLSTALEIPMQYIYYSMFLLFGMQIVTYVIMLILELRREADPVKEVTAL